MKTLTTNRVRMRCSVWFISCLVGFGVFPPADAAPFKKILLFDDESVLYRSGTKRVLHPLTKFIKADRYGLNGGVMPFYPIVAEGEPVRQPWEAQIAFVSVWRNPVPGPSQYQMWFQAYAGKKSSDKRKRSMVGYAFSADGITWKRPGISPGVPGLGQFDFVQNRFPDTNGNLVTVDSTDPRYERTPESDSNIVLIGSGGYGDRFDNSVIVEPGDPNPNRRYKMIFTDWANTTSSLGDLNDPHTEPNNIIPNPNPDPGHIGSGTQVAFSPDGITWTKSGAGGAPVVVSRIGYGATGLTLPTTTQHATNSEDYTLSGVHHRWSRPLTMADAQNVIYDTILGKYVIYGKMWVESPTGKMSWKHAMGRMESSDFVNWSNPELLLTTGDQDANNVKLHTSPVFLYEGVYLCLNQIYTQPMYVGLDDADLEVIDIELMSSRDGRRWNRNFPVLSRSNSVIAGNLILPRGAVDTTKEPGTTGPTGYYKEFDSKMIFTSSCPVILDGEIRFYYGGYGFKSGVGFATAPRDRIVGIRANAQSSAGAPGDKIGQVTLKPVDLTGYSNIAINAVADAGSLPTQITIEILNGRGQRITACGTGTPTGAAIAGDSLNRLVVWAGGGGLAAVPTADLSACIIRIHLENAELFSCSLVP